MTKFNKGIATIFALGLMLTAPVITANAAQSARWVGSSETWRVSDNAGGYLKNTWFQDDVTGDWYLMGAQDGTVMYAGLITDASTGKTYLLNINHDGTYGRMVTTNSIYNGVSVTFNQSHDGTFGAITSGLASLKNSGVKESSLTSIPVEGSSTAASNTTSTGTGNNASSTGQITADAGHQHTWVTNTIHHDEVGHYEKTYATEVVEICQGCGGIFTNNDAFLAHTYPYDLNGCDAGYSIEERQVETGSTWVVDSPAWDETCQVCSVCGAKQ